MKRYPTVDYRPTPESGYFTPQFFSDEQLLHRHIHTRYLNPIDPEYYTNSPEDLLAAAEALRAMRTMAQGDQINRQNLAIALNELRVEGIVDDADHEINDEEVNASGQAKIAIDSMVRQGMPYGEAIKNFIGLRSYSEPKPFRFSSNYIDLVSKVMSHGTDGFNRRTGAGLRFLTGMFIQHNVSQGLPVPGVRKFYSHSSAAELAWSLMGTKDITWLKTHTSMWNKFADENNQVEGAYGHPWIEEFGRDQISLMVESLREDGTSRQVHVSAWNPAKDGLDPRSKKLTPCPTSFTANVQDGYLNMQVEVRSSDLVVGLPYDMFMHSLMTSAIAYELELKPGVVTMMLAHAHIYKVHSDVLDRVMEPAIVAPTLPILPGYKLSDIRGHPDEYVQFIKGMPIIQPQNVEAVEVVDATPDDDIVPSG